MYGDAASFVTYHEARGRTVSAIWDEDSINAALLFSSQWLDGVYGASFIGWKTGGFLQVREWPRTDAIVPTSYPQYTFATDAIPDRVKQAVYEAAFRQLTTPGSLQVDYTPGKYKSVSIDGALSVEYNSTLNASDIQVQIIAIDALLWPLLDQGSSGVLSSFSGASARV